MKSSRIISETSPDLDPVVTARWLLERLGQQRLVVLDASLAKSVNPTAAAHKGVIPGAVFFDIENAFSDRSSLLPHTMVAPDVFAGKLRDLGIDNASTVVIYDATGIYSSARAWWMFRSAGMDDVFVLDGGLPEWIRCGFPVTGRHRLPEKKGNFCARPTDLFCDRKEVAQALESSSATVIDARSPERFWGREAEPRQGVRAGHIPGSVNLPFADCLDDGKLKSSEQLRPLFLDWPVGDTLIFSCGSGVTACIPALAATRLGYEKLRVYDGSWSEWGSGL